MNEAKLDADLLPRYQAMPASMPVGVIVKYKTTPGPTPVAASAVLADTYGVAVDHHYSLIPAVAVRATKGQVGNLSDDPNVEKIWWDAPVHVWLDVSVPLIGAPRMWDAGFTGKAIRLCIVDTGIDPDHPDFTGRIADSHDFTNEGVRDGHGHGTHCASIAAGSGAASNGKYRGVAPEATILVAKVLGANGSGSTSDVMAGVEWAVQNNAQVISLSLGSDGACDGSDALSQTCDAAMQKGHVVCVAAGNAGPDPSTVGSPGCSHDAITVGAVDDNDQIASFSSRGPTSDGRVKPDVCFPGVRITAARAKGTSMGHVVDDFYTIASGTSMATPHASGACALLLQAHPSATPKQVKDALMQTAKNIGDDKNSVGAGRAQVFDAHQLLAGPAPTPQPPPPTPQPPPAPQPPPQPVPGGAKGCLPSAARVLLFRLFAPRRP
jgi:serine protease AprX